MLRDSPHPVASLTLGVDPPPPGEGDRASGLFRAVRMTIARREMSSLRVILLVPIDNLAAGGEPYLLAQGDVRECLGKIFATVRVPH